MKNALALLLPDEVIRYLEYKNKIKIDINTLKYVVEDILIDFGFNIYKSFDNKIINQYIIDRISHVLIYNNDIIYNKLCSYRNECESVYIKIERKASMDNSYNDYIILIDKDSK